MNSENRHPKLISFCPDNYVEKYDVGFKFPKLDEINRQKLKLEIEEAGQVLTPIIVIPSAVRGYIIIDGWHRFHIAKELQLECKALLYEDLSPKQAREIYLSENLCRRQMTLKEKKQLAFDLKQDDPSRSNAQIAALLGTDPSTVSRWFKPDEPLSLGQMDKMANDINRFARELETFFDKAQNMHTTEYLKQARGAVSAMLFNIHRLRDAAEYLYEGLGKRLEDFDLEVSAESLVENDIAGPNPDTETIKAPPDDNDAHTLNDDNAPPGARGADPGTAAKPVVHKTSPPTPAQINAMANSIKKAKRELINVSANASREHQQQAKDALSQEQMRILKLRDALIKIYKDLDKHIKASGLISAELHEAVYGNGGVSSGIVEDGGKEKSASAA